jgi:hypothetical protein
MKNLKKKGFNDIGESCEWKGSNEIAERKWCVPDGNCHWNIYELWCLPCILIGSGFSSWRMAITLSYKFLNLWTRIMGCYIWNNISIKPAEKRNIGSKLLQFTWRTLCMTGIILYSSCCIGCNLNQKNIRSSRRGLTHLEHKHVIIIIIIIIIIAQSV